MRQEPVIASLGEAPNQQLGAFLKRETAAASDIPAATTLAPAPSNSAAPTK
jgi:hypothetical protein